MLYHTALAMFMRLLVSASSCGCTADQARIHWFSSLMRMPKVFSICFLVSPAAPFSTIAIASRIEVGEIMEFCFALAAFLKSCTERLRTCALVSHKASRLQSAAASSSVYVLRSCPPCVCVCAAAFAPLSSTARSSAKPFIFLLSISVSPVFPFCRALSAASASYPLSFSAAASASAPGKSCTACMLPSFSACRITGSPAASPAAASFPRVQKASSSIPESPTTKVRHAAAETVPITTRSRCFFLTRAAASAARARSLFAKTALMNSSLVFTRMPPLFQNFPKRPLAAVHIVFHLLAPLFHNFPCFFVGKPLKIDQMQRNAIFCL